MFIAAIVGLFAKKDYDRVAMTVASVQASIMICISVFFYLGSAKIVDIETPEVRNIFTFVVLTAVLLVSALSFFSRYVALTFVSFAMAYAAVWTVLYLFMLIFNTYISQFVYAAGIVFALLGIVSLNLWSPKIRERYAFLIFTSVTSSFYLCLSICVLLHFYVDITYFNKYSDFGKSEKIQFKNWFFLLV